MSLFDRLNELSKRAEYLKVKIRNSKLSSILDIPNWWRVIGYDSEKYVKSEGEYLKDMGDMLTDIKKDLEITKKKLGVKEKEKEQQSAGKRVLKISGNI